MFLWVNLNSWFGEQVHVGAGGYIPEEGCQVIPSTISEAAKSAAMIDSLLSKNTRRTSDKARRRPLLHRDGSFFRSLA